MVAATNQFPAVGRSSSTAYAPDSGLLGDLSWVFSYAVNGYHVASNGPMAVAVSLVAAQIFGWPPVTSWPCGVVRSNPNRCLPGLIGVFVLSSDSCVAPCFMSSMDPVAGGSVLVLPVHAAAMAPRPTAPMAARNCLREVV